MFGEIPLFDSNIKTLNNQIHNIIKPTSKIQDHQWNGTIVTSKLNFLTSEKAKQPTPFLHTPNKKHHNYSAINITILWLLAITWWEIVLIRELQNIKSGIEFVTAFSPINMRATILKTYSEHIHNQHCNQIGVN